MTTTDLKGNNMKLVATHTVEFTMLPKMKEWPQNMLQTAWTVNFLRNINYQGLTVEISLTKD
jgi:hypothetical protein